MRWFFLIVLVVHGLIHLLGFSHAHGLTVTTPLTQPVSQLLGWVWLTAALVWLGTAVALLVAPNWFWLCGLVAVVLSQALIFTSWTDAKAGTIANALVLIGVVYAFASRGPLSLRAQYQEALDAELARPLVGEVVQAADLEGLPAPVQRYLRLAGAVGQPQIDNVLVTWTGRIRSSATEPWMVFHADQFNSFGAESSRLFFMDAKMRGLPVDVFHRFVGADATFRVRVLSLIQLVNASGPELNRSETVTIFNDLCVLAPGRLLDPAVQWQAIDELTARARYTRGRETISAELHFNQAGELVDFVSDDRSAASSDGKTFTKMRWTTPLSSYRAFGPRRVITRGEARWEAPTGAFVYGEFELQSLAYNVGAAAAR